MPLHIDQRFIDSVVQQQIAAEEAQKAFAPQRASADTPRSLSPNTTSLLGSIADAASTYNFLSKGEGSEGNVLLGGLGAKPATAALGAGGMGVGMMALASLVRKKYPKLADTLQGSLASRQLAIGLENTMPNNKSSDQSVTEKVMREIGRRNY